MVRVIGLGIQFLEVLGYTAQKEPGAENEGYEEPEPAVGLSLHVDAQEVVDPRQRARQPGEENAGKHGSRQCPEEQGPVVLPEAAQFAGPDIGCERREQMETEAELDVAEGGHFLGQGCSNEKQRYQGRHTSGVDQPAPGA